MHARSWLPIVSILALPLPALAGGPVFTDITVQAGIALNDKLTESVAWGDYDDDGDEDLYLTSNGANNLFRNDGGGHFTDVTAASGTGATGFSVGAAFGDLDNDGDLDLYVVSFNSGPDVLYRNDGPVGPGSQPTFTDIAAVAGIVDQSSSRGIALIDYDADGLLDIYVNAIGPDILYHNLGGLQFENVAGDLGVDTEGQGVGAVATDINGDGRVDLFTGNRSDLPNRLYRNDGGTFTDITVTGGIDKTGLGMGVLSLDYDNDLDFDLYWTTWPGEDVEPVPNALYENLGAGSFRSSSALLGQTFQDVASTTSTEDPLGWGISCNAGDVDNDGWEDFFVTNGFSDTTSPNVLFHNQGGSTFTDITAVLGGGDFDGRGAAFADIDNDGDLDLVVTADVDTDTRLWRNDTDNGHRWLTVRLVGTASNRSAVGARIEVTTDLRTTVKEVSGGAGRGSQNSLPVEFGLGNATEVQRVVVQWPSGHSEEHTDVALDQSLTLVEGILFADGFESGDLSAWTPQP